MTPIIELRPGDCRESMRQMRNSSIDAVVTDPPYALVSVRKRFGKPGSAPAKHGRDGLYARASAGFMGKGWDTGEVAFDPEFWSEVLRVLKPGGHIVAFGGTRTYHRLACAIEDGGFEIRDQLQWLYGSGFPKSHDVSKGIDARLGAERDFTPVGSAVKRMIPGADQHKVGWEKTNGREYQPGISHAATAAAAEWSGWGTALKPANEPIVLARKPLVGTVAENVLRYGTGALNIDGCRVGGGEERRSTTGGMARKASPVFGSFNGPPVTALVTTTGRWPANIVHDGSDEVISAFPGGIHEPRGNAGSAARFFYAAKAGRADRAGSKHPTVKPISLMRWLCRLVTPPGGTVLDPFAGSGTTAAAALAEEFNCVLMEREDEYLADIRRRFVFENRQISDSEIDSLLGNECEQMLLSDEICELLG